MYFVPWCSYVVVRMHAVLCAPLLLLKGYQFSSGRETYDTLQDSAHGVGGTTVGERRRSVTGTQNRSALMALANSPVQHRTVQGTYGSNVQAMNRST